MSRYYNFFPLFLSLCLPILSFAQNKEIEYRLTLIDSVTKSPVPYVAVSLLNPSDSVLITGITNEKGLFLTNISQLAVKIRISCIGYATIEQTVVSNEVMNDFGTFYLYPQAYSLEEVTVTGKRIQHNIDKTTYTVTNKMREPVSDAIQLAAQIPGIRFDHIANDVKVDNQPSVLFLVNEVQQSKEYISTISPDRIALIEVVKNPTGRFVSDDYYAIINFILKRDDIGYDIKFNNFTIFDPANNNGNNRLVNEQPKLNISYFNKRIDAYLGLVTARIRWNYPINIERDYTDVYSLHSDDVTEKRPNQNYIYNGSMVNAGVQYQIATGHSFFVGGILSDEKSDENTTYQILRQFHDTGHTSRFIDEHFDQNKIRDYSVNSTYVGQVSPKWNMKADFAYNRNNNKIQNVYFNNNDISLSQYYVSRDYVRLGIDGNYAISSKFNLNLGQSNIIRNYNSKEIDTKSIWKREEYRSKLYTYMTYRANNQINIKLGGVWQYLNISNDIQKQNTNNFQPSFRINYTPNDYLNINGSYSVFSTFPSLYELNNNPVLLDSLLIGVGNPQLKPSTIQQASLGITLFEIITINSQYSSSPTMISPIYEKRDPFYYRTWQNMQAHDLITIFNLDTPLGDYFEIDASLGYHYQKMKYQNIENQYNMLPRNITLSFYHPKLALGTELTYNCLMDKDAMIQGYRMTNMDTWELTLTKQFRNRSGQLMVSYILPISWGRHTSQINAIKTPFYTQHESFGLKTYDNMLFIRFSIRFNKGKNTIEKVERTTIETDQKTSRDLK